MQDIRGSISNTQNMSKQRTKKQIAIDAQRQAEYREGMFSMGLLCSNILLMKKLLAKHHHKDEITGDFYVIPVEKLDDAIEKLEVQAEKIALLSPKGGSRKKAMKPVMIMLNEMKNYDKSKDKDSGCYI
jgi:hypothetical protein